MAKQRSTFGKLERQRAKQATAKAKHERRTSRSTPVPEGARRLPTQPKRPSSRSSRDCKPPSTTARSTWTTSRKAWHRVEADLGVARPGGRPLLPAPGPSCGGQCLTCFLVSLCDARVWRRWRPLRLPIPGRCDPRPAGSGRTRGSPTSSGGVRKSAAVSTADINLKTIQAVYEAFGRGDWRSGPGHRGRRLGLRHLSSTALRGTASAVEDGAPWERRRDVVLRGVRGRTWTCSTVPAVLSFSANQSEVHAVVRSGDETTGESVSMNLHHFFQFHKRQDARTYCRYGGHGADRGSLATDSANPVRARCETTW